MAITHIVFSFSMKIIRTCSKCEVGQTLTDYVMHQQFNIQQLYALPTPYLCVLYLSENKL